MEGSSITFFFSSRRRHTRWTGDWSSDVCSSDLTATFTPRTPAEARRRALAETLDVRSGATGTSDVRANYRTPRSEERRVGKESRSRWSAYDVTQQQRQAQERSAH